MGIIRNLNSIAGMQGWLLHDLYGVILEMGEGIKGTL
jgi:hypothetical protein